MQIKNIISFIKEIIFFILLFLLVVPMQIKINGIILNTAIITLTLLAVSYIVNLLLKSKIKRTTFTIMIIFIAIALYTTINSLFYSLNDISMLIRIIIILITFFGVLQYVNIFKKYHNDNKELILKYFILIAVINSIIMITVFLSEDFKLFLYSYVQVNDLAKIHLDLNLRMSGLFFSGFASLSTFNAMVLIMILSVYYTKKSLTPYQIVYTTIAMIIQFIGIVLSGRTGFLVLFFGLLSLIIFSKYKVFSNIIKSFILIILFIVIGSSYVDFSEYSEVLDWAFEFIFSALENNSFETKSTDILFTNMYFLPENETDIIFGTSNFGRSSNMPYINSDSTYILFIHGVGIIGLIILVSIYIYLFYYTYKKRYLSIEINFMLNFILITYIFVSFKDFYYFSYTGHAQLLFIYLSFLIEDKKYYTKGRI